MRLHRRITSIKPPHAPDRFFGGRISLVDVRSDREHMTVRVPGAAHLPLLQLHRRIGEIRTDRPVALLCRSGHGSALAARIAKRHGLDAMSVAGGMGAWLGADLPVVRPRRFTPEMRCMTQASRTLPTNRALGRADTDQIPEVDRWSS
jgi:rhodanese-related sulfurtransferase